jgi:hypothetical protein
MSSSQQPASEPRLGKHDFAWFAEEDLLREVPKPPALTRSCLNWFQCKQEESLSPPATAADHDNNKLAPATFKGCGGCGAKYCCRECQVSDWKAGHKKLCSSLRLLRSDLSTFNKQHRRGVVQRIIHEYRIYMCPFAVCKYATQGRGFLLVTSIDSPINDFVYRRNVDRDGVLLDRRIELEYLDMGEFAELCE